jgi:hypothetical protein
VWGAGEHRVTAADLPMGWTNVPWVRGLYREQSAADRCEWLPATLGDVLNVAADKHRLVAIADHSLSSLEKNWFAPALTALQAGRISQLHLLLDGMHTTIHPSFLKRWFARPVDLSTLISVGGDFE